MTLINAGGLRPVF